MSTARKHGRHSEKAVCGAVQQVTDDDSHCSSMCNVISVYVTRPVRWLVRSAEDSFKTGSASRLRPSSSAVAVSLL